MSFISRDELSDSLQTLVNKGFNTTETSSLVYFLALSKMLKNKSQPWVSLGSGTAERNEFVSNASELIGINDDHIWHPIGSSDAMKTSWNKGKNISLFISSNLFTTSYNRQEETYPKRLPLLSFSNGKASLYNDYQESLNAIFAKYPSEVLRATCIWILRTYDFQEKTVSTLFLTKKIYEIYGFNIKIDSEADKLNVDVSANQVSSLEILLELANEKVKQPRTIDGNKITTSYDETKLSKPFLLLAGISGTGKTRFVREQAKATGSLSDTYCLTSVRPDWHEPSDILGYISRLSVSGNAEYVTTEVLQFIAKAWRAIIDAGIELTVNDGNDDARLIVAGEKGQLEEVLPYWLCLDEMNLAPVEQYFADYLSVLETREWQWQGDDFDYCCDPLLKSATIQQLIGDAKTKLRSDLGFGESKYDREWDLFCEHGLSIPFNLIVAGTVNMDETTHGFSRKVIDRALSFDFGEFFPNDFDHFFTPTVRPNTLSYPIHAQAAVEFLPALDSSGERSIGFLKSVNAVLDNTPFQLAFRALNELLLAVISTQPETDRQLQAVWDDFLMCKVLPRIEGDHDKLTVSNSATTNSNAQSLFDELSLILKTELADIWDKPKDSANARPDLYREKIAEADDQRTLRIACRSKAKLAWMQTRLQRSGFTSFWP